MPAAKLQRTINSVNEHLLQLANAESRRTLGIGSDWQKIRIGIRAGFSAESGHSTISSNNKLYVGLLDSASVGRGGSGTIGHYIGWRNADNWEYHSENDNYAVSNFGMAFEKIENGSITTNGQSFPGELALGAVPTKLMALFVEIEKGSPWSIRTRYNIRQDGHTSHSHFENEMLLSTPETDSGTVNFTVDETTYGNLVVPTVFWENQTSHYLEIADFYVSKLA